MREMNLHRRFAEPLCLLVGVGDEDVAQHADRGATGKLVLRLSRSPALCERLFECVDIGLGERRRSQTLKCIPCSPAQAAPVVLEEPYQNAGCGFCKGRNAIGTSSNW